MMERSCDLQPCIYFFGAFSTCVKHFFKLKIKEMLNELQLFSHFFLPLGNRTALWCSNTLLFALRVLY